METIYIFWLFRALRTTFEFFAISGLFAYFLIILIALEAIDLKKSSMRLLVKIVLGVWIVSIVGVIVIPDKETQLTLIEAYKVEQNNMSNMR